MKLGEIRSGKGGAYRAPTKPVKFTVMYQDAGGQQMFAEAEAVLRFVPEDEAEECRVAAAKKMASQFPDGAPQDLVAEARCCEILHRALRDKDAQREPFADSPADLRQALQQRTFEFLWDTYYDWSRAEFPDQVTEEDYEELVGDAAKKSLPDLLSQHGSSKIRRAWASLVAHYGRSRTQTSTAGEPG